MKKTEKVRRAVQAVWALLTNSYLAGFVRGRLYQGPLKGLCVPGLNCYSCPGAVASCPIGALQSVLSSRKFGFSYYAAGFLLLVGALTGRFVCGWLCPFGLIQELLHRIPFRWKIRAFPGDRALRLVKYAVLLVLVIALPLLLTDASGQGTPWFCKLLCPTGTLEGGLPLMAADESIRSAAGGLFAWKAALLIAVLAACVALFRPFCKYLCPLGAVYSLFNPIAVFRCRVDGGRCTHCGACAAVCDMGVDPARHPNDPECIRCGKCRHACPHSAIR